jgi:nitroreductase
MNERRPAAADLVLAALRRTRQTRRFSGEPVEDADLNEILNVGRWSGSSRNRQPWTFLVIRDRADLANLAELAPNAKHLAGAALAVAIVMPGGDEESDAYDEARAAERMLIAANALGLGAAIGWAIRKYRDGVAAYLDLEPPSFVRTFISLGYPAPEAAGPKAPPGEARRPLDEVVRER